MTAFTIPEPFTAEEFELFQKGISDDPAIDVYINAARDFLFLHPTPAADYEQYVPRVKRFNLGAYKKKLAVIRRRFDKIRHLLVPEPASLLEIGAGDGSFLEIAREQLPSTRLTAVDKDRTTQDARAVHSDEQYHDIEELLALGRQYDSVCLFHVLEHIIAPAQFLSRLRPLLSPASALIIEVPSFSDPLLSLFGSEAYKRFYFQRQHPYVYSGPSLRRLMEYCGFQTAGVINYQRYGLENHLAWLCQGRPGGNEQLEAIFAELDQDYRAALEQSGWPDTVIWAGKVRA